MKKTFFIVIVTVCCLQITAFSQKSRVGVFGGLTSSNMHGKTGGVTDKGSSLTGFTFGMLVDAPIGKSNFSFQPTVQYAQKGQTISKDNDKKTYIALRYAELLLNFVYNGKGKNGHVFAGLGPALALPVPSARITKTGKTKAETSLVFGNEATADYVSLDYGVHFLGGYQFRKGCFLSLNYTLGVRNLLPGSPTDRVNNGSFAVKLGKLFNNK